MCSKPGKLAPSQNPSLFSQEIQIVFEMKLYIASAVLLRGMNLEFFSVISLKTAKKKEKHFVPDEERKTHRLHAGHLKVVFPLRPYHHQEVEKTKPGKFFSWEHNFNHTISTKTDGSREASFKQVSCSPALPAMYEAFT